jgi:adenosine deaminase
MPTKRKGRRKLAGSAETIRVVKMATDDIRTNKAIMKQFPKVELHRHLEGTFALPTLHRVALKNGLPYSEKMAEFKSAVQFPRDSEPDFLTFLSKFKNDWYRSHQDVVDIVRDSVLDFVNDGLFYIELRFLSGALRSQEQL